MQWLLLTFDACDVYDEDARVLMAQLLERASLDTMADPTAMRWLTPWFKTYASPNQFLRWPLHGYLREMLQPDPHLPCRRQCSLFAVLSR